MTRVAELSDIPSIMQMLQIFNAEYAGIPLNYQKTLDMVLWCIEDGVSFVSDSGLIIGVVVTDLLRDWTLLQEIAWYSRDRSGIKLFAQAGFSKLMRFGSAH